ncbi:hypothetical protein KM043_002733 [Ampulex compressa]|nr:hypothetical protein KM043_002733 [Ampulex compressa]
MRSTIARKSTNLVKSIGRRPPNQKHRTSWARASSGVVQESPRRGAVFIAFRPSSPLAEHSLLGPSLRGLFLSLGPLISRDSPVEGAEGEGERERQVSLGAPRRRAKEEGRRRTAAGSGGASERARGGGRERERRRATVEVEGDRRSGGEARPALSTPGAQASPVRDSTPPAARSTSVIGVVEDPPEIGENDKEDEKDLRASKYLAEILESGIDAARGIIS